MYSFTIDAIGTQKEIIKKLGKKKGYFCLQVKGNQKTLKEDIEDYFADKGFRKKIQVYKYSRHDKRMNILNYFFIFIHFFYNSISIYQKIILSIFLYYLFILLLNFFLNGSSSSIEIANFLRIFKFLAAFLFNVLFASSLNVISSIQ